MLRSSPRNMGIRKTHFPCRKPFGAIRLSHFSRIRLCRESFSTRCDHRRVGCGRLLLTSPHTHYRPAAEATKYSIYSIHIQSIRRNFGTSIHLPSALGSPADLSISLRDAGFHRPSKKRPTSSAYSCSNEDHRRGEGRGGRKKKK